MDNNDRLIRIRYALDIKDSDMIEAFKLGGIEVTKEELELLLTNIPVSYEDNEEEPEDMPEAYRVCDNKTFECFLNGFIILKKGKKEVAPGQEERPTLALSDTKPVNNAMLKKLKIALTLQSEDMLEIFELGGMTITKNELSALFRKEGHKHYKICGDQYAKRFLKGLAVKFRQ